MDLTWMLILMGMIILSCIIAAIYTFRISKDKERKQEVKDERGETYEDEVERSHIYEEESLERNLPNLLRIYAGAVVIAIVIFIVLFFIFS